MTLKGAMNFLIVLTVLAVLMQTVSAYTSVSYANNGTYVNYTESGDHSCFFGGCTTGSQGVYDNVIIGNETPHTYYYHSGTSYYYPYGNSNYYPSGTSYYPYGTTHYTSPTYYYPSYGQYYYPTPVYNYNYYYYTPYTWRYGYYPYA